MADRILVTGITGQVGSRLAVALLKRGYEVKGFVLPKDPLIKRLNGLNIEVAYGNLADYKSIETALAGVDIVVDQAAMLSIPEDMDACTYFDVSVGGKFKLMEAVAANGNVKRVVHASSVAAYSSFNPKYLPVDESHPLQPYFPYGIVKAMAEQAVLCQSLQHSIPTVVLRYGHIDWGKRAIDCYTANFLIGTLKHFARYPASSIYVEGACDSWKEVESAMENPEQLVIPRNQNGLTWRWNPCDVRDIVEVTIKAMESEAAIGEVFNIEGPYAITWEDGVRYIAEKTGRSYFEVEIPNIWNFETSIEKAKKLLDYKPRHDAYGILDNAISDSRG